MHEDAIRRYVEEKFQCRRVSTGEAVRLEEAAPEDRLCYYARHLAEQAGYLRNAACRSPTDVAWLSGFVFDVRRFLDRVETEFRALGGVAAPHNAQRFPRDPSDER